MPTGNPPGGAYRIQVRTISAASTMFSLIYALAFCAFFVFVLVLLIAHVSAVTHDDVFIRCVCLYHFPSLY